MGDGIMRCSVLIVQILSMEAGETAPATPLSPVSS